MQGEDHAAAGLLQEARLPQSAQVGPVSRTTFSKELKANSTVLY